MSLTTLPAHWWLPRTNWRVMASCAGLLFIAANVVSGFVSGYYTLMVCRGVSALGGGSLMILCLSAASFTTNKNRIYGLWVLGQLVIGALGLWLLPPLFEQFGLASAYWLLAAWMVVFLPLARAFPARQPPAKAPVRSATALPRLEAVLGVLALLTFYIGLSAVWTFIGGIAKAAGLSAAMAGEVLSVATLFGIAGASVAALVGRRSSRMMLLGGYAAMVVAIGLLYGSPALVRFIVAAFVFKFTWTFVLPLVLATLAAIDRTGNLMNYSNLVNGGGLAIGPVIAGYLLDATHDFNLLSIYGGAVVAVSLVLMVCVHQRLDQGHSGLVAAT